MEWELQVEVEQVLLEIIVTVQVKLQVGMVVLD
jgi:hypothetical protein